MRMKLLTAIIIVMLAFPTALAATVFVYPTFVKTFTTTLYRYDEEWWPAKSHQDVFQYNGNIYVAHAYITSGGYLYLTVENTATDELRSTIVDQDVFAVYGVSESGGRIIISYSKDNKGIYKIYDIDLNPVSGPYYCVSYVTPPQTSLPTSGKIICSESSTPVDPNFYPVAFKVEPIYLGNGIYEYVFSVSAKYFDGTTEVVLAGQAVSSSPEAIVRVTGYYSTSSADGSVLYPIAVGTETPDYTDDNVLVYSGGLTVTTLVSGTSYFMEDLILPETPVTEQVSFGSYSTTYDSYTILPMDGVSTSDATQIMVGQTFDHITYGDTGADVYLTMSLDPTNDDILLVARYSDGTKTTVNVTNELSELGYSPVLGNYFYNQDVYSEYTATSNGNIYYATIPVTDANGDFHYVLIAYMLGDTNVHILRALYDYDVPVHYALYRAGDDLVLAGDEHRDYMANELYVFKEFWVSVDPPYFQEPPGSTISAKIFSTVPATLVGVYSPQYVTVDAPPSIDANPQTITFSVSPDAPEGEYGVITLTYKATDGTEFNSGVLYRTQQVNDPPTTPQILGADISGGTATIRWEASVDPDGDPVTYMVRVYDETDMVTIYEGNVSETSVSVPVTVKHTYTVYVTATDGNLSSDTATYQFTYTLSMSVQLIDPVSGTYVVGTVPCRVAYTSNVDATLYIETSLDGVSWNITDQQVVSGSGNYSTTVTLQPGTNYIRARLVYGSDEVVSDVASVYYDTNTTHVLTMVEPTDGAEYQVAQGAQLEVTFTAVFDTSSDTGTRKYMVVVTDTNGNAITVASVSTDEPIYTLQGTYGLPAGEYIAYPVYVNPFGSEIYGNPVSFSIVETSTPNNPPSTPIPYDTPNTTEINVWLQWHASTDPEGDPITYHVVVATDDTFSNVVFDTKVTSTQVLATNLYGGNVYYWKVQACDASGLCSAWSPTSSFIVFESTSINIDDPADGGAYVADETNTAKIPVQISVLTNTNKQFELNVVYTGGTIDYQILQGPFDKTFEYNLMLAPGEYNIVATMKDLETNEVYLTSVSITVYAYGTEAAPIISLIDPTDGYYEEIDPLTGHTTITTRASFELPKEGNNYVAIEYKLKWAATWTTITDATFTVTPENNTTSLTANVDLTDGVYLFRAKVVDPDGIAWYSETHSVIIRLSETTPTQQPSEEGGGGGGGGGAAPILVPEKVVWEVGSEETTIRTVTVKNVGTSPIKVKIWYDGEIAAYILAPPEESKMIIPPGDYNISFKISGKGQPAGTVAEGSIVLAPTGTTIEIPVEIHIVEGTTGPTPGIDVGSLIVPIIVVGALVALYLMYTGVI